MKKIFEWFAKHSGALQGMAALVVIVGAIFGLQHYVASPPNILVKINIDDNTIPPDLAEFNRDVSRLADLYNPDLDEARRKTQKLDQILSAPILKRLDSSSLKLDKAHVEIKNQSGHVISGIRIRFDDIFDFWGLNIAGTYLQESEAKKFMASVTNEANGDYVVLPELPSIPPGASLELTLYGRLSSLKPSVTTSGDSYSIVRMVKVEDGALIRWYRDPFGLVLILIVLLPLSFLILNAAWLAAKKRIKRQETKNIFYDWACQLATKGASDDAMVLLQQAVDAGFSDTQHALRDEDLASLRDREDFKDLFKT